ncbi:putative 6-phosphogluconolactonase [Cladobotryum mycophilum]|uniref:6-phosphogluconolactonase n=1 Tax=Cladobotryum mycophilum TaxID=491253 RepID=A0ABR0SR63_9HYPO
MSSPPAWLLISRPGHIFLAAYDGTSFTITLDFPFSGSPSWIALAPQNLLYTFDERGDTTHLLKLDLENNTITHVNKHPASPGVCHLEFNANHTRMVGSSYRNETIDIWDIENGRLKLIKTIRSKDPVLDDPSIDAHPHQAVLDPTSRFFVVNDCGTNSLLLLDSEDESFPIVQRVRMPSGSGPRHGIFFPSGTTSPATHYILLCETSSRIIIFSLEYTPSKINFTSIASYSTFHPDNSSPGRIAGTAAGQIVLTPDNRHVYTSNRLTSDPTDTIAHFRVLTDGQDRFQGLEFVGETSTRGYHPRMFSLSRDGRDLLIGNKQGEVALVAIRRQEDGTLEDEPRASMSMKELNRLSGEEDGKVKGPKFVLQIA